MIEAPAPPDEEARLAKLHQLSVLYTPAEDRFDRITRLACRMLQVPIALVSLVDRQCQWFKSVQGLPANETPRAVSFCAHAIADGDTLVVEDATQDERFADNPLVTGEPHIRYYAGHPVQADDGSRLGTLCVIDVKPRTPTPEDIETLRDLAGWVSNELRLSVLSRSQRELISEHERLRRSSLIDDLTRIWNRKAIGDLMERERVRAQRDEMAFALMMIDVDRFKGINDAHGHPAGDAVLRGVAKNIRASIRPYDAVGRYGGEEFLAILIGCAEPQAMVIAERIRERVAEDSYRTEGLEIKATLSIGVVVCDPATRLIDSQHALAAADRALYRAKRRGRNRVEYTDTWGESPNTPRDQSPA